MLGTLAAMSSFIRGPETTPLPIGTEITAAIGCGRNLTP